MTQEEAKELSIKKWEYLVKHPTASQPDLITNVPNILYLRSYCGYCELYNKKENRIDCTNCPIDFIKQDYQHCGCNRKGHPFLAFINNRTKRNAQTVLNLIKQS